MSSIMMLFLLRLRVETTAEMWFNSSIILFHCTRTNQHLLHEFSNPIIIIHIITQQNRLPLSI